MRIAWNKGKKTGVLSIKHRRKISISLLGNPATIGFTGKEHTNETRKKMSESKLGHLVSQETRKKLSKAHKGKKVSIETRRKISIATKGRLKSYKIKRKMSENNCKYWLGKTPTHMIGENNPNWKGGVTSLNKQIRHCYKYKKWRKSIFQRDNYTCQICSKRNGGRIEADHYPKKFIDIIKEFEIKLLKDALSCKELWEINNGRTLCLECHNKTKWKKEITQVL